MATQFYWVRIIGNETKLSHCSEGCFKYPLFVPVLDSISGRGFLYSFAKKNRREVWLLRNRCGEKDLPLL